MAAGRSADTAWEQASKGSVAYRESVLAASQTVAEAAQANVTAATGQRESLSALRLEYERLAAAAEEGSATQVAAARLAEDAARRLGEVQITTAQEAVAAGVAQRESLVALAAEYKAVAAAAEAGSAEQVVATKLAADAQARLSVEAAASRDASVGLSGVIANLATRNNEAAAAAGELSKTTGGAGLALGGMGVAGAAAAGGVLAVAGAAFEGTKKLSELAFQTLSLERVTGAGAEQASTFRFQLRGVGIDSDTAVRPLMRFSRSIAEHADKFAEAGIAIAHYRDGSTDVLGTLDNMRLHLQSTGDASERMSLMMQLMGRGALSLGPYLGTSTERLRELADEAERTGHVIDQSTITQEIQLKAATRELGAELQGVELKLATGLLPQLVNLGLDAAHAVGWVTDLASKIGDGLGKAQAAAADSGEHHSSILERMGGSLVHLATELAPLSSNQLQHLAEKQDAAAKAALGAAEAHTKQQVAAQGLQPYLDSLSESEGQVADIMDTKTIQAAQKLQQKLSDLGGPIGLTGDQLLAMGRDAAQAGEDAATAAERIAKSIQSSMQAAASAFSRDFSLTDAFSASSLASAAKATDTLAQAQQSLADKQAELASKGQLSVSQQQQLARAQDAVGAAASKSADDQARAARNLSDLQARLGAQSKMSISDQVALRNAQDAVAKAQKGVNDETRISTALLTDFHVEAANGGRSVLDSFRQMTDPMHKAQEALRGLLAEAGNLDPTQRKIVNFYSDSLVEAKAFSDHIREAIRQGYDPGLISQLLQEGPKQAAPLLQALVSGHDTKLREFVNASQEAIGNMSAQIVEATRLTNIAVTAGDRETAAELKTAQAIDQQIMVGGTNQTVAQIAALLGKSVDEVAKVSRDYGLGLAAGINPVLSGIGSATIDTRSQQRDAQGHFNDYAYGGIEDHSPQIAKGGPVRFWAEPETEWEAYIPGASDRRPRAVEITREVVHRFGYEMVPKAAAAGMFDSELRAFAAGGFSYPSDVPQPPDLSSHGTAVGYAGNQADRYLYDKVVAWVAAHPPGGNGYGFQALVDYLRDQHVPAQTTSTTGGTHVPGSLHYRGLAADFVSANMRQIFDTFLRASASMQELFYDPAGFSVKRGQRVPWTVGGHTNHVHAATWAGPSEGPGLPTGGGGGIGGTGNADRDWIIAHESGGNVNARNPSSGAFGLGQLNPSSGTLQEYAARFGYNPYTTDRAQQLNMMDAYVADRYGNYANARRFWETHGWYGSGGIADPVHVGVLDTAGWYDLPPGESRIWNGVGRNEPIYASGGGGGGGTSTTVIDYGQLADAMSRVHLRAVVDGHSHPVVIEGRELGRAASEALHDRQMALHR